MARGPKKHMKRMFAPKHWMMDKLNGVFAPRPSAGPHKLRECLPLIIILRNRLKYALTYRECKMIVMQRLIKVDGKIRTDMFFPAGFMDVLSIDKTKEHFRLLYNTKGRFVLNKIKPVEAETKLCGVKRVLQGPKGSPQAITHDGRTLRFPDPDIKAHDSVVVDLKTGAIKDKIKFKTGALVMVSRGKNQGRVGVITHRERHPGSFDIIRIQDSEKHVFATQMQNVFVIGDGEGEPRISMPPGKGIKLNIIQDRARKVSKRK